MFKAFCVALVVCMALLFVPPASGQTGPIVCSGTQEQSDYYINSVNAWRVHNGLNSLIVAPSLNAAALTHSAFIADEHALIHGTYDQLWQGAVNGGTFVGENLGMGHVVHPDGSESIFQALIKSPGHNENMLNPDFDYIGVGTCTRDRYQYTTHRFMASWIIREIPTPTTPIPQVTPVPATATPTPNERPTSPIPEEADKEPAFGLAEPKFVG